MNKHLRDERDISFLVSLPIFFILFFYILIFVTLLFLSLDIRIEFSIL